MPEAAIHTSRPLTATEESQVVVFAKALIALNPVSDAGTDLSKIDAQTLCKEVRALGGDEELVKSVAEFWNGRLRPSAARSSDAQ